MNHEHIAGWRRCSGAERFESPLRFAPELAILGEIEGPDLTHAKYQPCDLSGRWSKIVASEEQHRLDVWHRALLEIWEVGQTRHNMALLYTEKPEKREHVRLTRCAHGSSRRTIGQDRPVAIEPACND